MSFDVIYEMATRFGCYGRNEVIRLGKAIQKDGGLAPYLKKGMDPNAW